MGFPSKVDARIEKFELASFDLVAGLDEEEEDISGMPKASWTDGK